MNLYHLHVLPNKLYKFDERLKAPMVVLDHLGIQDPIGVGMRFMPSQAQREYLVKHGKAFMTSADDKIRFSILIEHPLMDPGATMREASLLAAASYIQWPPASTADVEKLASARMQELIRSELSDQEIIDYFFVIVTVTKRLNQKYADDFGLGDTYLTVAGDDSRFSKKQQDDIIKSFSSLTRGR